MHMKKWENLIHNEKRNQSKETDVEVTQIMKLADRDFSYFKYEYAQGKYEFNEERINM